MPRRALALAISSALGLPAISFAHQNRPAAAPTTQTQPIVGEAQALQGTITGVEGKVQVRMAEGQPWQDAKVGMMVDEGAEFRTGIKSAVRIEIPGGHTISLDRLGTMKLLDAVKSGNTIKTDVGMKYGRVRYDIEAAGEEHDSTIHSPGGTLAIRGTEVSLFDCPGFPAVATSLTGKAKYRDTHGHSSSVGGKGAGKHHIVSGTTSAAQTALHTTFVDPTAGNAHTTD